VVVHERGFQIYRTPQGRTRFRQPRQTHGP
jgi:hypothetical protein